MITAADSAMTGWGRFASWPAFWVLFFTRRKSGFACTSMICRRYAAHFNVSYQRLLSYWQPNWSVKNRWAGRWGRGEGTRCVSACLFSKMTTKLSLSSFSLCRKISRHVANVPIAKTWAAVRRLALLLRRVRHRWTVTSETHQQCGTDFKTETVKCH